MTSGRTTGFVAATAFFAGLTISIEEIRPGGLGLHFMREAMDTMGFLRNGPASRTRLVKYLVQTNDTP